MTAHPTPSATTLAKAAEATGQTALALTALAEAQGDVEAGREVESLAELRVALDGMARA